MLDNVKKIMLEYKTEHERGHYLKFAVYYRLTKELENNGLNIGSWSEGEFRQVSISFNVTWTSVSNYIS